MSDKSEQYGQLFDNPRADIDLKGLLESRAVVVINVGPIKQMNDQCKEAIRSSIIEPMLRDQTHAVEEARSKLSGVVKAHGKNIQEVCEHKIKDEFHEPGDVRFKCLVCGMTGTLE